MSWHRANSRRYRKRLHNHPREREPYLGYLPGEPLLPMRRFLIEQPRLIDAASLRAFAGIVALLVFAMMIVTTWVYPAQGLAAVDERQVRKDCYVDALRYCKRAMLKADRSAIIACMLANKPKLKASCARHLW